MEKETNQEGVETCNWYMLVLTDVHEYSIVQVPYLKSDRLHSVGQLAYVSARNHILNSFH